MQSAKACVLTREVYTEWYVRQPTEKKIQKNRGITRCMKTRFQPVFFDNGSQTIYSVFSNRLKPRLFFGRGY
jgi:hypothetical protein